MKDNLTFVQMQFMDQVVHHLVSFRKMPALLSPVSPSETVTKNTWLIISIDSNLELTLHLEITLILRTTKRNLLQAQWQLLVMDLELIKLQVNQPLETILTTSSHWIWWQAKWETVYRTLILQIAMLKSLDSRVSLSKKVLLLVVQVQRVISALIVLNSWRMLILIILIPKLTSKVNHKTKVHS